MLNLDADGRLIKYNNQIKLGAFDEKVKVVFVSLIL
jgi:hypothetical protein